MSRDPLSCVRPEIRSLEAYSFAPLPGTLKAKLVAPRHG